MAIRQHNHSAPAAGFWLREWPDLYPELRAQHIVAWVECHKVVRTVGLRPSFRQRERAGLHPKLLEQHVVAARGPRRRPPEALW